MPHKKRGPLISQRQTLSGRAAGRTRPPRGETSKQGASLAAPLPPSSSSARSVPVGDSSEDRKRGREGESACSALLYTSHNCCYGRTDGRRGE